MHSAFDPGDRLLWQPRRMVARLVRRLLRVFLRPWYNPNKKGKPFDAIDPVMAFMESENISFNIVCPLCNKAAFPLR